MSIEPMPDDKPNPHDRRYEVGGLLRCCVSAFDADLPDEVPVGYTLPCKHHQDGGLTWTGTIWRASWIKD